MGSYVIPNLANACRVLALVAESEQGLSLTELEQRLAVPRTTTFRILQTLCQQQLLEKQGKRYLVGSALFKMSCQLVSTSKLSREALPFFTAPDPGNRDECAIGAATCRGGTDH